jgi:HEAT repeat
VLYVLSAVVPPAEYVEAVAEMFTQAIVSSTSWRVRLNALPTLVVFWYRNLTSFSEESVSKMMDVLLQCLHDENLEVREMAAKTLSSVLRSSQRQRILPLKASRHKFVKCHSFSTLIYQCLGSIRPCCQRRATSITSIPRICKVPERAARGDPRHCCADRCISVYCYAVDAVVM